MGVFIVRRRVLSIFRRRHMNSIRFAETACIIGISQGAWTVLKFAVSHPERVSALVLLSPGGIVPDKLSFVVLVLPLLLSGRRDIKRINRMVGRTIRTRRP
jgi:pimeloyl-ACP methyl ester carboxylesterase